MPPERRSHSRLARWFDGSWRGGSGANRCRVSDVSLSGCFVNSLAAPQPGDRTTVTFWTAAGELSLHADVAYVEKAIGFGVKFVELSDDQKSAIESLMGSAARASA